MMESSCLFKGCHSDLESRFSEEDWCAVCVNEVEEMESAGSEKRVQEAGKCMKSKHATCPWVLPWEKAG